MSLDPWAALAHRRRRRHWRQWPWGAIALGLALLSIAGIFPALMLAGAGMRPPGDGGHGLNVKPFFIALGLAELVSMSSGFMACVLAWRLNRGRVTGAVALVLLSMWAGVLLHDLL